MINIFKKSVGLGILLTSFTLGSLLEIYQDGAKYRTIPTDRYIGFSQGLSATCDGQEVTLLPSDECSDSYRLCKERRLLSELEEEKNVLNYESKTLDKILAISKPTEIDADRWIKSSAKIGKQKAILQTKTKKATSKYNSKMNEFANQAPSQKAIFLKNRCAGELEVAIPAGDIGARLLYEADIGTDDKIQIKQYLAVTNRSGIDIVAKELYIYAKPYRVYLRPQQFNPWIARIQKDMIKSKRVLRKSVTYAESMPMLDAADTDITTGAPARSMGAVMQIGYKNYHVSGVELPSTGEEIKVKIADYQVSAECENISYPYMDSRVYKSCAFTPKSAIESNKWRIQQGKRVVSDQAYGEYRDGKYLLNVDVDDEIIVKRKPIVKKDRGSGIFGGSIKKKDGFELTVANISKEVKNLKIIERIPTSTTDKIKVKLLKITGADSHKLLKDGKIEISLSLTPKEHREIKVMFEISYDKDTKIVY